MGVVEGGEEEDKSGMGSGREAGEGTGSGQVGARFKVWASLPLRSSLMTSPRAA